MSLSGSSGEDVVVQTILQVVEVESSEEAPREEWSSLLCFDVQTVNEKRLLYEKGLFEVGSGEICSKYIAQSDSSVFRHHYYKYPAIIDPGIEKALLKPEEVIVYGDDGQDLYLLICTEMNQPPVKIFHKSLLDNKIDLKYYCVNPSGIRPMALALQFNRHVKILDLTDNFLNDDACYHLGDMLTKNNTLKELNLSGCRIGASGAKRLFAGLSLNRSLQLLNLNKNQLGDSGLEHFIEAVTLGLDIQKIYLSYNNITSKITVAWAEAYEVYEYQNKLTHIDLSWNSLFSPLLCNLINILEQNIYLEELNLAWNSLTGPRIGTSIKSLMKAKSLQRLDLSNNKLSGEAITSIVDGIKSAKKLVTLNLSDNPIEPENSLKLLSKLKLNSVKIQNLLLDNVPVSVEFINTLQKVKEKKNRQNTVITYGNVIGGFQAKGEDPRELILNRAEFLCKKPKKIKFDIALIIMELVKNKYEIMELKAFTQAVRFTGAPLDDDLLEEMANIFPGPKSRKAKTINLKPLVDYVHRKWPERELPPTPPPEPEPEPVPVKKGKDKGKGKEKK